LNEGILSGAIHHAKYMETTMQFEQFVTSHETEIRLGFFVGIFALVAIWELVAPRRALTASKTLRWSSNIGIVVLNTLLLRLIFPLAAVGTAAFCAANGWGAFNHFEVPFWLAVPLAVVAMDFVIWLQHVMFHSVPVLWRLHRVHHADLDYDLTTGSRFHPIEIVLSMLIKIATISVLGPPVVAVVIFEVLLNTAAMFNHGNIRLPASVDRFMRWFIVTPDMHRVHHSVEDDETNSNFGFNLPWWDRLLGTYREQPRAGQVGMAIGIHGHTDLREVAWLDGMLLMPFNGKVESEGYVINRRVWPEKKAP
jgi:sterol desaturase/sphingolipid hydroxylase (fatty acid hydroxylase superfamily)